MNFKPANDRVTVKPDEKAERKTSSGIVLAESSDSFKTGVVLATPDGFGAARPGDRIAYSSHFEATVDGQSVFLVAKDAIVGVIRDDG